MTANFFFFFFFKGGGGGGGGGGFCVFPFLISELQLGTDFLHSGVTCYKKEKREKKKIGQGQQKDQIWSRSGVMSKISSTTMSTWLESTSENNNNAGNLLGTCYKVCTWHCTMKYSHLTKYIK